MDDKWFKQQQKRAGITAEDLGRMLGRDRSVVSRLYVGRQKMTLEQARVFAQALDQPLATVLEKAGVAAEKITRQIQPGLAEGDAAPWHGQPSNDTGTVIARALGADRPGIDVWKVQGGAMQLGGYLPGDFILVDTHAAERCTAGDVVIAQVYNRNGANMVLRRYEAPVLVAASCSQDEQRVHVVDGTNVVIRGKVVASWRA